MSSRRIDRLCRELLPAEFERVSRLAPEIQQFLEHNLPESVNRSVRLLTVGRDEIVIAAFTPMVASYLRMHAAEISQQLRETFALDLEVRFRTLPESLLDAAPRPQTSLPREVGAATVGIIERGAETVDDEQLREALRSLARSMKSASKAEGAG